MLNDRRAGPWSLRERKKRCVCLVCALPVGGSGMWCRDNESKGRREAWSDLIFSLGSKGSHPGAGGGGVVLNSSQEAPLGVWLTMHLTLLDQNPKRAGKGISRKEKLQGRCGANPRAHPGLDVIHVLLSESRGSSLVQERAAEPRDGCGCTVSGGRVPSLQPR